ETVGRRGSCVCGEPAGGCTCGATPGVRALRTAGLLRGQARPHRWMAGAAPATGARPDVPSIRRLGGPAPAASRPGRLAGSGTAPGALVRGQGAIPRLVVGPGYVPSPSPQQQTPCGGSWSARTNAIPLADSIGALDDPDVSGEGDGAIQETSTASAVSYAPWTSVATLRIYGVSTGSFEKALEGQGRAEDELPEGTTWATLGWDVYTTPPSNEVPTPSYPAEGRVQVLEVPSSTAYAPSWSMTEFELAIDASAQAGAPPPVRTGVPTQYEGVVELGYETIAEVSRGSFGSFAQELAVREGRFGVVFKDPHVIELPDEMGGGWLMVLARYRVPAGFLATRQDSPTTAWAEAGATKLVRQAVDPAIEYDTSELLALAKAETSAGDVVAFHARDPGFTDDLRGPFLLVDSLRAVPRQAGFRLWLGVPSAAVATDPTTGEQSLYVHYVVESNHGLDQDGGLVGFPLDSRLSDEEQSLWLAAEDAWAGGGFEEQGRGIAVKRIAAATVRRRLNPSSFFGPKDERDWTHEDALEGELFGRVRILVPVGASSGPSYVVRTFEEVFPAGGSPPVKVDPAAIACGDDLHLFFCARERNPATDLIQSAPLVDGTNGHGIWHAVAVPSGTQLAGADSGQVWEAVHGRDFVVRRCRIEVSPGGGGATWPDQVVASDVTLDPPRVYQDPDPSWQPDGGIMVLMGASRATWYDPPNDDFFEAWLPGPLVRVDGDSHDVCWDWSDAFRSSAGKSLAPGATRWCRRVDPRTSSNAGGGDVYTR
ncbi:MAG: hypothetical protein QME96_14240, partial [Myxococcota bacterium]|nr:hypothetical protein [Myxococcota bacterium]